MDCMTILMYFSLRILGPEEKDLTACSLFWCVFALLKCYHVLSKN